MILAAGQVAHQGGWDEALFVAGPMLVIIGLLWLAKRRADQMPRVDESAAPITHDPEGRSTPE